MFFYIFYIDRGFISTESRKNQKISTQRREGRRVLIFVGSTSVERGIGKGAFVVVKNI